MDPDLPLIQALQAGDDSALNELINRHREPLFRFVYRYLHGDAIPERFHVTEVGHVVKNFIDCGGTVRKVASAQLQIWLGEDRDHRLTAGRLAKIIDLAGPILPDDTLPVEVEYENCVLSQYTVEAVTSTDQQVTFSLADKHTDCLAKELCCPTPAAAGAEAGCGCGPKCC